MTKLFIILLFPIMVYAMDHQGMGSLTVITGPMYSGKTEELIKRITRYRIQNRFVFVGKHSFDNRLADCIASKGMIKSLPAVPITDPYQLLDAVNDFEIVTIDEVQFFNRDLLIVINRLISRGVKVVASGLDTDFKREPFGECMPLLLSIADKVIKLKAVCSVCHKHKARLTQRLVSGAPASAQDELVIIDNGQQPVTYEPRCRDCHVLNMRKSRSCDDLYVINCCAAHV